MDERRLVERVASEGERRALDEGRRGPQARLRDPGEGEGAEREDDDEERVPGARACAPRDRGQLREPSAEE